MVDGQNAHAPDLAALLGAAIVVLLTLTFGQGAWGPISTIIGLLILFMMFAYFWEQRPGGQSRGVDLAALAGVIIVLGLTLLISPGVTVRVIVGIFVVLWVLSMWRVYGFAPKDESKSIFVGIAFSVVVGLVGAITVAQAVQSRWFSGGLSHPDCRSVATAKAATAVHDLSGTSSDPTTLSVLVGNALKNGAPDPTVEDVETADAAMTNAFHDEYESAIGDCLAGETFEQLWWVGVPLFFLTLAWWTLSRNDTSAEKRAQHEIRVHFRRLRREQGTP